MNKKVKKFLIHWFKILNDLQETHENSLSFMDTKSIEENYLPVIEKFCASLKEVYENLDLIKNSINDHMENQTITMNLEYQK